MLLSPAADRPLVWFLRLMGAVDCLALLAVVMPATWMAAVHQWLGMGELPTGPLMGYLARSASAVYGLHGAMILFVSFDVARYRPLIAFLAWAAVLHGAALVAIDVIEGMPWWWTLAEGPVYLVLAAVTLILLRMRRCAAEPIQQAKAFRLFQ